MEEYSDVVIMASEMMRIKPDDINPGLIKFLDSCSSLTQRVGGELVSRQAIAVAVATYETFSVYIPDDHRIAKP